VEQKNDGSPVTEIDTAIERMLVTYIQANFPNDGILGEEGGAHEGNAGAVWHIDPIDGTNNFMRKIPFCAVSVARLSNDASEECAVVHNPLSGQTLYTYGADGGVFENGRPCSVTADSMGGEFLVTVCAGRKEHWMRPAAYALRTHIALKLGSSATYRSCALEIAYVAANRIDGVLCFGLSTYDYAAGLLLSIKAGAIVSIFEHGEWVMYQGTLHELCSKQGTIFFVSHKDVHQKFVDFVGNPERWGK
jgi:myo-inositol-1(or 4)-monophosphatase